MLLKSSFHYPGNETCFSAGRYAMYPGALPRDPSGILHFRCFFQQATAYDMAILMHATGGYPTYPSKAAPTPLAR
jgi:hypothetical protein